MHTFQTFTPSFSLQMGVINKYDRNKILLSKCCKYPYCIRIPFGMPKYLYIELLIPHKFIKILLVSIMNRYGVESIFQICTSHPTIWLNDFENIWQGFCNILQFLLKWFFFPLLKWAIWRVYLLTGLLIKSILRSPFDSFNNKSVRCDGTPLA